MLSHTLGDKCRKFHNYTHKTCCLPVAYTPSYYKFNLLRAAILFFGEEAPAGFFRELLVCYETCLGGKYDETFSLRLTRLFASQLSHINPIIIILTRNLKPLYFWVVWTNRCRFQRLLVCYYTCHGYQFSFVLQHFCPQIAHTLIYEDFSLSIDGHLVFLEEAPVGFQGTFSILPNML